MTAVSTFRQELEAAVLERHCAHHPMTQKWARGELGRDALMGWGIEHYHWISNIRPSTFYKMARAPIDVRRALLENLMDEEAPDRPHLPIVLRFAEANGANTVLPALREIYKFPEDVIEHFWLHCEADVEHGGRVFELLERHCTTEELRQMAIHWARESAKMRWFYFDGIYLHYELGYKLQ